MLNCEMIENNLNGIRREIEAACDRSGRSPDSVLPVVVTKYAELDWVRDLIDLGVRHFGESRPQQLSRRAEELSNEVRWHMIGHLQRNKVDMVLPVAELIHSIDSFRLLQKVESSSSRQDARPRVLLEINVSGEASKDGFSLEEISADWQEILKLQHADIVGLMTMAPHSSDPETARPFFRQLRELRDRLVAEANGRVALPELSMGMSGDFAVAIEEGATLVRIGSRVFEGLSKPA